MIIESVQLKGFGCITGEYEFARGMNLIVAANESGKTTLADALIAILYGIKSSSKRGDRGALRIRRYLPHQAEGFSGSAVVRRADGSRINIWRDFALGKLRVLELASGKDITTDFEIPPNGDCLGQSLTGLSREQYLKLVFLSQDELNKDWDFVEFVDSLSTLFSTDSGEGVSVEEARAVLESQANLYAGVSSNNRLMVGTEIKRLQQRIDAIEREVGEILLAFGEVEEKFAAAANQRLATEQIRNSISKYDYLICLLQYEALVERFERKRLARESVLKLQAEVEELEQLNEFEFKDIEIIAEKLALLSDKQERVEDIVAVKNTGLAELEYLQKRVDNLGKRANITSEYLQRIEQSMAILENNLGRERSVRIDCRSAEALMLKAGVDAVEVDNFNKWKAGARDVEVEFVVNYNRIREQLENKESRFKSQRQEQLNLLKGIVSERGYRYRAARNNLVLGCVFTGVSVFSFVAMGFMLFMLIPAVVCLGWAIFGALRLVGVNGVAQGEYVRSEEEILRLDEELSTYPEKFSKMEEKLNAFAALAEQDKDGLLELIARMNKASREVDAWEQRVQRHKEVTEVIEESYATLKRLFCEIGIADEATRIDISRARVFMREVSDALALSEQFQVVKGKQEGLQEQENELADQIAELKAELEEDLLKAGVEVIAEDYAQAMDEFKVRSGKLQHLRQLEEIALPAAISAAGDVDELDSIELEIDTWAKRISAVLEEEPWLEAYEPEQSILEYGNEIKLARLRLEDTEGELVEREKSLAIEDNRRRERLPVLSEEKARLEDALYKARRFQQATSRALAAFERISSELHSRWSPIFSEEFNAYIAKFSSKFEFSLSKELKLCAVLRDGGVPVASETIAEYLSKGMRDQVYLSLRLMLSQKVATDTILPIILDDPFINADDQRFVTGMEQLLELSRENQVFVFSCHELRHEELCAANADFAQSWLAL